MLHVCPFRYTRYNPETGYNHVSINNSDPDERQRNKYCNYGKGPWCAICPTYRQSLVSNYMWKKRYKRMGDEGKAPHLWNKPNPERIVNPVMISAPKPLRLSNFRRF